MSTSSLRYSSPSLIFFFFNDTATTEIYTLSLHDALPIFHRDVYTDPEVFALEMERLWSRSWIYVGHTSQVPQRSEEHTSELQSHVNLVCRLLLEKKKKKKKEQITSKNTIIISNA